MSNGELLVFEFGGTARSGKGTIVSWLSEVHPEVATEETGADYRAATLGLLQEGVLDPEMPGDAVKDAVKKLSVSALSEQVARRSELEESSDEEDPLHGPEVSGIVHYLGSMENVRKAVKQGFKKRVESVRDDDEHGVLLVDGRNLGPVVETIKGTQLVLRTFVYCMPFEAARRECARAGLSPGDEGWDATLFSNYRRIADRNDADARRELDPVVPDQDKIEYWTSQDLLDNTVGLYAHTLFEGDEVSAIQALFRQDRDYTDIPRIGAGLKAVREQRQLHFDTTHFRTYPNSKHAMLLAANTFFEEAKSAHTVLNSNGK